MRTTALPNRFAAWPALASLALLAAGCTSLSAPRVPTSPTWPESLPLWPNQKEAAVAPETVAVVWTKAVLQAPNATPTRGLGGLVTFYGSDRGKPMKAEGRLTVYAYKDSPGKTDKIAPDVKYVFPAEQLANHYGRSALGDSYSIWIPWDQAGGPRQELTLTVGFEPAGGKRVMGTPTRVVLEGPSKAPQRRLVGGSPSAANGVVPAEFVCREAIDPVQRAPASVAPEEPPREMSTTTLSLPLPVLR